VNKDAEFHFPPSLFTYHTHDDFDSADPSSVQDACHICTQLNALHEFLVAQWIERPAVGDSEFFFVARSCHVDPLFT